MSDVEPNRWTWNISNIDNMTAPEIRSLLETRNCNNLKGKKMKLLQDLKEKYEIDDKNMKPLNELSVKQLKAELILRNLSTKNASKQDLIQRLYLNKIPSIDQLLVYGYIRENEIVLKYGQFIPFYLKELVVNFCESSVISYYLTNKHPNYIFIANINNQNNQKWKAKIIELNSNNIRNTGNIEMELKNASICSTMSKSLVLPSKIQELIRKHRIYNTDKFHMIFKIGNTDKQNWMLLMNENEISFDKNKRETVAFKWNIPPFPTYCNDHYSCFDEEYGVLTLSGNTFCSLSFKSSSYLEQTEWKWTSMAPLPSARSNASFVVIKTNENKKKLFVVGGIDWNDKSDFYDFKQNKWHRTTAIKKAANKAGICYNNIKQTVYIGGGDSKWRWSGNIDILALQRVQCFDLNKEKCYILPNTIMEHRNYPILWNDENNHNLLFIGSVYQNGLEYIDLRMQNKKWNLVCIPNHTQGLSNKFGVKFSNSSYSRLCVTQF